VLDDIKDGGGKGLTFAPEAGTQRMRDVINKNVTEAQLLETARRVFSRGFSRMKLYFMIGLPTETDEDVLGIVETGARALGVGRELIGKAARVTVSVSTHVPKPHTPFQWSAMDARDEVLRKQQMLRDAARRSGVELKMHDSQGSFIEGVLARGDRTLADVIEGAYLRGARFDSWEEQLKVDAWREAFAESAVDPQRFLGTLPTSARLAWQHIDVGLEPNFLAREYRKALKNRLSPPCGKAVGMFIHHTNLVDHESDARKLVCYDCGVACDLKQMRVERGEFLGKLGALTPPAAPELASESPTSLQLRVKSRAVPPTRPDQGTPIRLRLGYRKLGRAAFTSHLDLVRMLPRLFRRLDLPVYYSLGFHSKPVMIFGPALSLGVASLGEYVDVKLCSDATTSWDELPARLNEASMDGLDFFGARLLSNADAKLSQVIQEAVYVAGLPRATLESCGLRDEAHVRETVTQHQSGELRTRRSIDGIGKWIDVKSYLVSAEVGAGAEVLAQAGIVGDLVPVRIQLKFTDSGTAKASEALATLLAQSEVAARFVRASLQWRMGDIHGTPLELERLREVRSPVSVAKLDGVAELSHRQPPESMQ
jgi:radical SAM-linked protein